MLTKIQKWGNSQGIRIPKNLLKNSHIEIGEEVNISTENGKIIVEPTNKIRGKYNIHDLVRKMPKGVKPKEEDWGEAVGKEVW